MKFKSIQIILSGMLVVSIFQGCGSAFQGTSKNNLISVKQDTATIEVASTGEEEDLVLEVPEQFLASSTQGQEFEWYFVDEDGNVLDLQTNSNQFDLTGLDFSFFANGTFKVKLPGNSAVEFIIFIIRINRTELPVIGLPSRPVGDPIIGLPPRPVIGVPRPVGDPVIGLPPRPVGEPVIGVPPRPVGDPVIGLPPRPVIGVPRPVGDPVIGMPKPVGIKVIGLPQQ